MMSLAISILVLGAFLIGCCVAYVNAIDRQDRNGAQPLPSARQIRAWRRERMRIDTHTPNQRRRSK